MESSSRRTFLKGTAASLLLFHSPWALAKKSTRSPKVVWVVLRGALDGMHTVIPSFDPMLATHRPSLSKAAKGSTLQLEQGYLLHSALPNLHQWYKNKQLTTVVAVGTGYGSRSHFDGQDYLEWGGENKESGWLARALEMQHRSAIAVSQSTPLSLQGTEKVTSWYPSRLKDSSEDTYRSILSLYDTDPALQTAFKQGVGLKMTATMEGMGKQSGQFVSLAQSCGRLLKGSEGADCGMLELGGWDTHNNQEPRLKRQFAQLDKGLVALKEELGEEWDDTLMIIATEFGRTVKQNGTQGTDHGTASVLLFAGGRLPQGGKVLGEWPGLKENQLYQGRDLKPTSNTFDWISQHLAYHWDTNVNTLNRAVRGA
ncbi:DUF1501 domain-containing protein [Vibrio breoganii]|uniref:DUF1501 domain-containing protein n=1 Tax=Vibrio breoganii TaxID=553239 RepID=UPI000C84A8BE|nr:DUF1501 domain-containing protein [Vibrio breoganii]PMG04773.1 hypothetical protein BCV00_14475 [Vibrio breoganii]PMK16738.1 hypothetical protein BCU06_11390 [Vibrio breoganii]PMK30362.1 hypothetical protein BCU03_01250 [Vibrio breoganii]